MVYDLCVFLSIVLQTKCFGILISKLGMERSADDNDDNSPLHSVIMQTLIKGTSLFIPIFFQYRAAAAIILMSHKIVVSKNAIVTPEKLIAIAKSLFILAIGNSVLFINIYVYKLVECCAYRMVIGESNSRELGLKKLK